MATPHNPQTTAHNRWKKDVAELSDRTGESTQTHQGVTARDPNQVVDKPTLIGRIQAKGKQQSRPGRSHHKPHRRAQPRPEPNGGQQRNSPQRKVVLHDPGGCQEQSCCDRRPAVSLQ